MPPGRAAILLKRAGREWPRPAEVGSAAGGIFETDKNADAHGNQTGGQTEHQDRLTGDLVDDLTHKGKHVGHSSDDSFHGNTPFSARADSYVIGSRRYTCNTSPPCKRIRSDAAHALNVLRSVGLRSGIVIPILYKAYLFI